jgi:hypothetical protein
MNPGLLAWVGRELPPNLMGSRLFSDVHRGSVARLGLFSPNNSPGLRDGGVEKEPHSKEDLAHVV